MKKIFLTTLVVLSISFAQAQISFVSKDSTLVKDFYAGYLGGTSFKKNLTHSWLSSARMGAGFSYQATKKLQFVSFGVVDISNFNNYDVSAFGSAFVNYKINKVLTLQAGNIQSSITGRIRPYALTREGQYEFVSLSSLPGIGLGAKAIINYNSLNMELNVMNRSGKPEYQVYMGKGGTEAGMFYNMNGEWGSVFRIKNENFSSTFILKQKEEYIDDGGILYDSENHDGNQAYPQSGGSVEKTTTLSGNLMYRIHKKKNLWLYTDVLHEGERFSFFESGLSKSFQSGNLGGFINLSWVYDKNTGKEVRLAFMLSL